MLTIYLPISPHNRGKKLITFILQDITQNKLNKLQYANNRKSVEITCYSKKLITMKISIKVKNQIMQGHLQKQYCNDIFRNNVLRFSSLICT